MILEGVIASFDDARGDGTFASGDEVFSFHCVAILDGSRTIDVGVRARARRCVGRLGRDEVLDVEALEVHEGSGGAPRVRRAAEG